MTLVHMNLIIVESPTKAKTLNKFLGKGYTVDATVGHIMDLPKSKIGVDVEKDFAIDYKMVVGKEAVVAVLKKDASKASKIYLATDPDREGEAIAAHVAEVLKNSKLDRVVFHEITQSAVEEAIKKPRKIDKNLVKAQEARRVLDRIVGYTLSPLLWEKLRYGLSAGRVQSAALRIIMEREREIRAFIPEDYFVITATFEVNGKKITLVCDKNPKTLKEAQDIIHKGEKGSWIVVSVKKREINKSPYPPFITSTMQRSASARFGFSPSRTMRAAQKLYEAGHITYMRTDSTYISKEAQAKILSFIKKEYGDEYAHERFFKTNSKNAQEAHEAIRVTNVNAKSVSAQGDGARLYDLIWKRTVASQMASARLESTKISANIKEGGIPNFSTTGSRILFDGWLKLDVIDRKEDVEVPKIDENQPLKLKKIEKEDKQTVPPDRYTEAGIVKELETRGIGRPSTYATITKTIVTRGYVLKEGRTLIPTDTGDVVSSFLEKHFLQYISDTFTAEMENELDDVANGKLTYEKLLGDFYKPFIKDVNDKKSVKKLTNLGNADEKFKCPVCKKRMVIKLGRTGKFLSCSNFPKCKGALTLEGKELGEGEVVGKDPKTGEKILLLNGRFGPYVQLGEKTEENPNPKRASVPKGMDPDKLTLSAVVELLKLPRVLGIYPKTGEEVIANIGRYGPYVGYGREFRSLRKPDDPRTITLESAIKILETPKQLPKGVKLVRVLGEHPKTGRNIQLLESKSGVFVKKGLTRLYFNDTKPDKITLEMAVEVLDGKR